MANKWLSNPVFIVSLLIAAVIIARPIGADSPLNANCISCHNETPAAGTAMINVSATNITGENKSIHLNLNNLTSDPGTQDITVDWNNRRCWACHGNGSAPTVGSTHDGWPNLRRNVSRNCPDCHANNTRGMNASTLRGNYSAPGVFAHVPDFVTGNYSRAFAPPGINTTAECYLCHNRSVILNNDGPAGENNTARSNVSHYGTKRFLPVNSTKDCAFCHKNGSRIQEWYFNYTSYGILENWYNNTFEIRHPAKYNKTSDVFGGVSWTQSILASPVNKSACRFCHFRNISFLNASQFHSREVRMAYYVHRDYDWEGDNELETLPGPDFEACFTCHFGGMQAELAEEAVRVRKKCEDCHTINSSTGVPNGPYSYYNLTSLTFDPGNPDPDDFVLRSDYNESIPIVFNHMNLSSARIRTKNMSAVIPNSKSASTCVGWDPVTGNGTCHGVSWENASDQKYFFFGRDLNRSTYVTSQAREGNWNMSPYLFNAPIDFMPNTSNCKFCHYDLAYGPITGVNITIREKWGFPPMINSSDPKSPMFNATSVDKCYNCHTSTGRAPLFFHEPELQTGCEACHFSYSFMNSRNRLDKWINETMFKQSVHGGEGIFPDVLYCDDCHTVTSNGTNEHPGGNASVFTPPEYGWKWCEACHVVQPRYANQTPNKADSQRHNMTNRPQNIYYNITGTSLTNSLDVKSGVSDQSNGCIACHSGTIYNNSRATYNRTISKDCRFCHTFPDREPGSPYT